MMFWVEVVKSTPEVKLNNVGFWLVCQGLYALSHSETQVPNQHAGVGHSDNTSSLSILIILRSDKTGRFHSLYVIYSASSDGAVINPSGRSPDQHATHKIWRPFKSEPLARRPHQASLQRYETRNSSETNPDCRTILPKCGILNRGTSLRRPQLRFVYL